MVWTRFRVRQTDTWTDRQTQKSIYRAFTETAALKTEYLLLVYYNVSVIAFRDAVVDISC